MAAGLSLVLPGLGQMFERGFLRGLAWAITVGLGYRWLPLVGISLHILCVLDAHAWDGDFGPAPAAVAPRRTPALAGRCTNCGAEQAVDAYSCANCAPHAFT